MSTVFLIGVYVIALPALANGKVEAQAASEPGKPKNVSNELVMQNFVAGLNRHDVDAQYALYAKNMVYLDGARRVKPDRESERTSREFEAANDATWRFELSKAGPDWLVGTLTEDMLYYRLLGVGVRSHEVRVRFRDAKIVEMSSSNWTDAGCPYEETRDRFFDWLLEEKPRLAADISRDGRPVFNGETAHRINQAVREWCGPNGCRNCELSENPNPDPSKSSDSNAK